MVGASTSLLVGMSGRRTVRLAEIALGVDADSISLLIQRAGVVSIPWVVGSDMFPVTGRQSVVDVESEAAALTAPSCLKVSITISVQSSVGIPSCGSLLTLFKAGSAAFTLSSSLFGSWLSEVVLAGATSLFALLLVCSICNDKSYILSPQGNSTHS